VFGGFTPVEWDLRGNLKGDRSLRSFLFTLKNPHGVPPRKFALREERKESAIGCYSPCCAVFGGFDIVVKDNCNTNRSSFTRIGTQWGNRVYANDTPFEEFFTGAHNFTVKDIEVFEISEETNTSKKMFGNTCLSKQMRREGN
jgi:hypothetical protein